MRKLLGYSLLVISCLAWTIIPMIPFLSLSVAQKASWATVVFVFAEVTWWLAMPLLGKEIIDYSKAAWQRCKVFFSRKGSLAESQQADNYDK
ncbi:MAG: transporter suffix domain-containing protein [Pseudomonadota bacterium]|nr:transporter suffix domain-containing protein [Pseudomonadota bacterium]